MPKGMDVTYPAPSTILTDWKSISAALEKVVAELAFLTTQFAFINSRITKLESAIATHTPPASVSPVRQQHLLNFFLHFSFGVLSLNDTHLTSSNAKFIFNNEHSQYNFRSYWTCSSSFHPNDGVGLLLRNPLHKHVQTIDSWHGCLLKLDLFFHQTKISIISLYYPPFGSIHQTICNDIIDIIAKLLSWLDHAHSNNYHVVILSDFNIDEVAHFITTLDSSVCFPLAYTPLPNVSASLYDPVLAPITLQEWSGVISSMPNNKASGLSKILYEMLKHLSGEALDFSLLLANTCLSRGEIPADWREAVVYPIPKPHDFNA
ncbi:hypothetical protein RhiirC2_788060 [Rhizophagus irregularis]|uniref:Endonuclease/exonuclease/phosphatase domain-containing protein n=1 Tax=Rhizophagus irregularis TaxID=588596 RepID=A0A2N1MQX8_9GLOM|nr:hypothetical protein RhiirC2_788060 [Rhizophagus irregularis]